MSQGVVPSADALAAIGRAENVSVSWLLSGKGAPFLVSLLPSDAELAEHLEALADEDGWTWTLLDSEAGRCLALTQPGQFEIKGRAVNYTIVELVCGPVGAASLAVLAGRAPADRRYRVHVSAGTLQRIRHGQVGTYELLQKDGGLLRDAEPWDIDALIDRRAADGAEPAPEACTGDERALVSAYRKLSDAHRKVVLSTIQALEEAE